MVVISTVSPIFRDSSITWIGFSLKGVLFGGTVAGVLDGLDAIIYFGLRAGANPAGIFKYIAGGLIGLEAARAGGWGVVVLGVALHFLIAIGAAATYSVASRLLPWLLGRVFIWGPVFGIAVYFFMNFVVLPLSLLPQRGHWPTSEVLMNQILIHMFGIGLPIAWFVSRSTADDNGGPEASVPLAAGRSAR